MDVHSIRSVSDKFQLQRVNLVADISLSRPVVICQTSGNHGINLKGYNKYKQTFSVSFQNETKNPKKIVSREFMNKYKRGA